MSNNLLITGPSGSGKSTAVRSAIQSVNNLHVRGFLSTDIVESERRVGWTIEGLGGLSGVLVHSNIQSQFMLGSLGVDMELFERIIEIELLSNEPADLFVVDEIGVIGGWSESFIEAISIALDSETPVVAVLREKSGRLEDAVRQRADTEVISVTTADRHARPKIIERWIQRAVMIDRN